MNIKLPSFLIPAVEGREIVEISTRQVRPYEQVDFWRETVCRLFADVEIASRLSADFFGEMRGQPWGDLRLTHVSAGAESVARRRNQAQSVLEDCYFFVLLLQGEEFLEQDGREVLLRPGDMTIYDGARPHQLTFPQDFQKLILQIPRHHLRERIAGVDHCTTLRIPGMDGAGAIASNFFKTFAAHAGQLNPQQAANLSEQALDLLALAVASVRPVDIWLSRSRSLSLCRVKSFVEQHLGNPSLDTAMVALGVGLSPRYTNRLFEDEGTSLMRYIWKRRLDRCRNDMLDPSQYGRRMYDIALRWGFNDPSHFSRAFKKQFGISPRELPRALSY
jgi:AraC family transcriptional activator of tynA and feaB